MTMWTMLVLTCCVCAVILVAVRPRWRRRCLCASSPRVSYPAVVQVPASATAGASRSERISAIRKLRVVASIGGDVLYALHACQTVPAGKQLALHWWVHAQCIAKLTLARRCQYGPISALDMPGRSLVCVADPGAIKQVLKRPAHYGRSSFFKRAFGYVADGLLVLEGSQWQAHRRLLQPVFHARNLTGVVSATNSACDALFSGWARLFPDGKRIPVHTMWPLMSMDVIGKVGFGLDFNCVQTSLAGGDAVSVAPTEMMEAVEALFRGVEVRISLPRFLWRFRKDAAAFDHARRYAPVECGGAT